MNRLLTIERCGVSDSAALKDAGKLANDGARIATIDRKRRENSRIRRRIIEGDDLDLRLFAFAYVLLCTNRAHGETSRFPRSSR